MKLFLKILKWIGIILGMIILVFVVVVYARQDRKFEATYPDIHAVKDSAVIAHGEYLAFGPAHCANCHATKEDMIRINKGEHLPLRGGYEFILPVGIIRAPNITPDETGIASWTDQEIARALRHGVSRTGRAVFDFMPFQNLCDDDMTAIISFIRSQPPVHNEVKRMDLNFIGKAVNALIIKPVGPNGEIAKSMQPDTTVEYGKYLATNIMDCKGCHTERSHFTGAYIGQMYGGGSAFDIPENNTVMVTPNITTNPKSGRLYNWSYEKFHDRIKQGRLIQYSPMPWNQFQQINDNDLKALYKFLVSIPPVDHDPGPVILAAKK